MSFAYQFTSEPHEPPTLEPRPLLDSQGRALEGPTPSVDAVREALSHKAIFLSASENVDRGEGEVENIDESIRDRHRRDATDGAWLGEFLRDVQDQDHQHPRRVLRAVSWLCTFALQRDYTLIFGGHPAISPMVLEIARRHVRDRSALRVLIFQSEFFAKIIPSAAKDLARWPHACMLTTPAVGGQKGASLTRMRELMLQSAGLRAGVYIGGMGGLLEESYLFGDRGSGPRYAIGSTGGAARYLLRAMPDDHCGRTNDPELRRALTDGRSYPAVVDQIFDDLELVP